VTSYGLQVSSLEKRSRGILLYANNESAKT